MTALIGMTALSTLAQEQVSAEAIQQANLRALPNVESDLVGQIQSGTRYPVIGRSEFFPWYLLADPASGQPIGWVFSDLVTLWGSAEATIPISTVEISASGQPTPTINPQLPVEPGQTEAPPDTATDPLPTATPTLAASVTGTVLNEINIRYAPGTQYERVGIGRAGEQFEITAWHTQFPWVQIAYPASPNGLAWVATDLLDIQGDISSLPSISQTQFSFATLTPTPSLVDTAAFGDVEISPEFRALGTELWNQMVEAGFDPQTSRMGALFLKSLETGEAMVFDQNFAFSGMSINKIAILATYYSQLDIPPGDAQAVMLAEAMICSENISTNEMLSAIGNGNPYAGAERVSEFLQQAGLTNTFLYTPFANDPFITPQAPRTRTTDADQISTEPDPFNQMTVSEIGMLLDGMYQCAYNESGILLENFDGAFTPTECRQMLHLMTYNRIGNFIEAGVPADVRVAHKHGWINDTHGDAGLVFSPGGDYILVVAVHNPVWMNFEESSALIENMSLTVYNYFNPDQPMEQVRDPDVGEECILLGNPVIEDLMALNFDG